MKIELGQFYLGGNTIYIFNEEQGNGEYVGTAWQNKLSYRCSISEDGMKIYGLTPITPEVAKLALFSQDPKP